MSKYIHDDIDTGNPMTCEECGEPYVIDATGKAKHTSTESTDGIDHDADAHHEPYGDVKEDTGDGNTCPCPSCGTDIPCSEDGQLEIGSACPLCGDIAVDHESLRGAGLRFSGVDN